MRTVRSFRLIPDNNRSRNIVTIALPSWSSGDCTLLHVGAGELIGVPYLWVLMDNEAPRIEWQFEILRDGESAGICAGSSYVGTAMFSDGARHVFRSSQ